MRRPIAAVILALLAACSSHSQMPPFAPGDAGLSRLDVLLLGEQHDAPDHQETHRKVVEALAGQQRLAAVAIEMAEQGTSTAGLEASADEAAVRDALRWNDAGWPWQAYRDPVMAAVRAGVTVLGANLPRSQLRVAMADSSLDRLLPAAALEAQQQAIRLGHCGLLPESQIAPMARVQVGRDRAMAQTIAAAASPGKIVVLLAGRGHVDQALGVPQHLPALLRVHAAPLPERPPQRDYCDEMRRSMKPAPAR